MKSLRVRHGKLPAYVAPCLKILRQWQVTVEDIKSLPRKLLEKRILSSAFSVSLALRDCPGSVMREGLRLINLERIPLKFRDQAWLAFHGRLYVRGNLKHRPVDDRDCPRAECVGKVESMDHFLLQCPFNIEVYKRVGRALGIPFFYRMSYAEWVYGAFPTCWDFDLDTLFLVSIVVRYFTWNARCQITLRKKVLSVEVVVHDILGEVGKIRGLERGREPRAVWKKAWRNIRPAFGELPISG